MSPSYQWFVNRERQGVCHLAVPWLNQGNIGLGPGTVRNLSADPINIVLS